MTPLGEAKLLTIRQAAALVGIHPLTLRNWSQKGTIPCLRTPGGHRRYRLQDLQRVLTAPHEDPATAAAIVQQVRRAVRAAVAEPPRARASALHRLRADLSHSQRRSLAELGRELLGLLIRYAVPEAGRARIRGPVPEEADLRGAPGAEYAAGMRGAEALAGAAELPASPRAEAGGASGARGAALGGGPTGAPVAQDAAGAVAEDAVPGAAPVAGSPPTGALLRRGRQLGRSYGLAARRLGLPPSAVVATFNFFQDTVVRALAECDALNYARLNRLFGVVLLAAVAAAEPAKPDTHVATP